MRPARIAAFMPSDAPCTAGGSVGPAVGDDGCGELEASGPAEEPALGKPTSGESELGTPTPGEPTPGEPGLGDGTRLGRPELGEPGPGDPASGSATPAGGLPIGPGEAGGRNGTSKVWEAPSESSFDPAVIAANVGTDANPTRSATMST
jgi:hypothetical protein